MYNDWFMKFAPKAFRETRVQTTKEVEIALHSTGNLTNIRPATMRENPAILPTLRMAACPPLAVIKTWLEGRGYQQIAAGDSVNFDAMLPGTFGFRMNVPVKLEGGIKSVTIPIDAVISPKRANKRSFPVFFEAKSAGDFTNTNKRRKEEAVKISQLRSTYGSRVQFNLFLCGYFDSGYLGYEAAEGIDWVWEHRIDDLAKFGI